MLAPLFLAAALAAWPAPLRSAVEAIAPPGQLAFTMTIDSEKMHLVASYNPLAAPAQRWTVKEPTRALTKDEKTLVDALKKDSPNRQISCASPTEMIPAAVTLKSETAEEAVYSYTPAPTPKTPGVIASGLKHTRAEIRVSKTEGRILGGRYVLVSPYSPAPFTSVKVYSSSFDCTAGPSGSLISTHSSTNMNISMLGADHPSQRVVKLTDIQLAK